MFSVSIFMFSCAVVVELQYCFGIKTYKSTCTIRISWKFLGLYLSELVVYSPNFLVCLGTAD